jgi:hypothetical protein
MKFNCAKCSWSGDIPLIQISGTHNKAVCPECRKYIKFLSSSDVAEIESIERISYDRIKQKNKEIIIVQECSAGNDSVGDMWLETAIFNYDSTLQDVINWRDGLPGSNGRLMITIPNKGRE